jgi:4'-phosphopantetheinyl transferase
VSNSNSLAAFAFGRGREIGIDIEQIRSDIAAEDIAGHHFSAEEVAELRAVPPGQMVQEFFLYWTQKEAYIKARGLGLQIPLDSFSFSVKAGQPTILKSEDADRWSFCSFRPAPGFIGAIVAEGVESRSPTCR